MAFVYLRCSQDFLFVVNLKLVNLELGVCVVHLESLCDQQMCRMLKDISAQVGVMACLICVQKGVACPPLHQGTEWFRWCNTTIHTGCIEEHNQQCLKNIEEHDQRECVKKWLEILVLDEEAKKNLLKTGDLPWMPLRGVQILVKEMWTLVYGLNCRCG